MRRQCAPQLVQRLAQTRECRLLVCVRPQHFRHVVSLVSIDFAMEKKEGEQLERRPSARSGHY